MKIEKFVINDTEYSQRNVLIVAELGTSHGADAVKAGELIEAAAEAGADCIKFQIVYAREILHPNTGDVVLPGGKTALYDRFRELELPPSFYAEMKERVEKKGLIFLCTPFGIQSARELYGLRPKCLKIASPELNYTALLSELARYKLPTLLSTGVSKLSDIEEALEILTAGPPLSVPRPSICLLHCVTSYPAPEKDYNLRVLKSLSSVFGLPVGVSDHSLDPCLVPALGTAMGAAVIEKHFCLDKSHPGLDDPIALDPANFAQMVQVIRQAQKEESEKTVETLCRERGWELVESILGDGIKRLAPSEKANYGLTNRSIHAMRDISKGETIGRETIACLRTEKNLRPGLAPQWEEKIIGLKAAGFIPAGEGIRFSDLDWAPVKFGRIQD